MAMTGVETAACVGLGLSFTTLAGYFCYKSWNSRMRREMEEEIKDLTAKSAGGTAQMRKFFLGGEKLSFIYGYAQKEVRFFQERADGSKFECTFPVAALKTAAAAALLQAIALGAQVPAYDAKQVDQFVHQIRLTIDVTAPATAGTGGTPTPA